jgi:hypothetical protein
VILIFPNRLGPLWISFRQLPDGSQAYQAQCASTGGKACGMLSVDNLWISAMAANAIERASSLIRHWERRFELCRLDGQSRRAMSTPLDLSGLRAPKPSRGARPVYSFVS